MNKGFLGALYRALDSLQLLGNLQTWSVILNHFDDGLKVAVGTLKPSDNGGGILVWHVFSCPPVCIKYPPRRIKKVALVLSAWRLRRVLAADVLAENCCITCVILSPRQDRSYPPWGIV